MKYLKLNNIFKLKDSTLLIDFCMDYKNTEIYINPENVINFKKSMKSKSLSSAIIYWKKYEGKFNSSKKKPISISKFTEYVNKLNFTFNFIGSYLLNIQYQNVSYLIDFHNDKIEICDLLESYDNSESEEIISEKNNSNNANLEDDLINKIKNINESLPMNLESLIKFSMENSELVKSVLKIVNSKTDNVLGNFINSFGFDLNLNDKINSDHEIKNISCHLKIIEELNNNDLSLIKHDEKRKFNFIISQIWNEIKLIISSLEKMLPNNNYNDIIERYRKLFNEVGFKDDTDFRILKNFSENYINSIAINIFKTYYNIMESKYLELNILLQGSDDKFNKIIEKKVFSILEQNFNLFQVYFFNIFDSDDVFNIFSEFNKNIKFDTILTKNDVNINSNLILLINDSKEKTNDFDIKDLKIKLNDFSFNNKTDNLFELSINSNSNLINEVYIKYEKIINLIHPNKDSFLSKIDQIYNDNLLIDKKTELSRILQLFHEEVKFILSIVKKITSS